MINEQYKNMLGGKSVIREFSEFAAARGKEIGYENVFDYSLGNPSVPVPDDYTKEMEELLKTKTSMELHGYSPSLGLPVFKESVAASLNRRFGMNYTPEYIFPTSGAAGALAHALRCVTKPGDEVLTFAPYFPEYGPYVNLTGAVLKVVPADTESFQINFEKLTEMLNENTAAVLINTPNNPSGAVYSAETLEKLAKLLTEKQQEYGHEIFIISDEPYREIVFDGAELPYVSRFYANTLSCYSYSKSLSLPGERIGYVYVPQKATDGKALYSAVAGAARAGGHVCAPSLWQKVIARCAHLRPDLASYDRNRKALYEGLTRMGYEMAKPDGAFYLFIKAPGGDANAFSDAAKKKDLLVVPGDGFGCPGYFRVCYCVSLEMIQKSLPVFEELIQEFAEK